VLGYSSGGNQKKNDKKRKEQPKDSELVDPYDGEKETACSVKRCTMTKRGAM
jgi:hypothetical protein